MIYLLSYLPFVNTTHPGLLDRMLANQTSMFNYHSGLEATHPYSSSWYEWPTMVRPIWYYSGYVTDAIKEGISAFGNPVVWWIGIPAFIYILYLLIRNNAFLCSLTGHTKQRAPQILQLPCPTENMQQLLFWQSATWRSTCPGSLSPGSLSSTTISPVFLLWY